jgi:tellurite resistance protein TehA-like permease
MGQSITGAGLLGRNAHLALPPMIANAYEAFGLIYGVPMFGFALLWVGLALAVTIRTTRLGLPFALTWWSFTFPVGTMVTGTSVLAAQTGLDAVAWLAAVFYAGLVAAWITVGLRTTYGSLRGYLLR